MSGKTNEAEAEMKPEGVKGIGIDIETIKYIEERSSNLARYSNKLSEAITTIQKYFERVGPISGVSYIEPRIFYTDEDDDYAKYYCLAVEKSNNSLKYGLKIATFDSEDVYAEWTSLKNVDQYGRSIKKMVIRALPKFMRSYAAELQRLEKEYEDMADKAEKMAKVLNGEVK